MGRGSRLETCCVSSLRYISFVKTVRKPRFPKCGRDAEKCGKISEKQKGRGFNLCVVPSLKNQVSRISDGTEKGLRIMKE